MTRENRGLAELPRGLDENRFASRGDKLLGADIGHA